MIVLSSTDSIRVVTTSANAVDVLASHAINAAAAFTPTPQPTTITAIATTTVVTAPAATTTANISALSFRARGGANTLTVQFFNGAAFEIVQAALNSGDTLLYENGKSWLVVDSSGATKTVAGGIPGHVIRDDGADENQRAALNFTSTGFPGVNMILTDDPGNNETEVAAQIAQMVANSIIANATAGLAFPTELVIAADSIPARVGGNLVSHPLATLAGGNIDYAAGVMSVPASSDTVVGAIEISTQAEQVTGTDNTRAVVTGRQHFHPSAAKCWGFTTGAGTPALNAQSYNMTSITDTGVGILTVTIATDFSSANFVVLSDGTQSAATTCMMVNSRTKAASSVILDCDDNAGTAADPGVGWNWVMYGTLV